MRGNLKYIYSELSERDSRYKKVGKLNYKIQERIVVKKKSFPRKKVGKLKHIQSTKKTIFHKSFPY